MQKRTFFTFSEASNFARYHAQEIGATVQLAREDNNWVVFSNMSAAFTASVNRGYHSPLGSHSRYQQDNDWRDRHLEEQRKREEQEQKRRELKQKAQEEEIREHEKRRSYLEEQRKREKQEQKRRELKQKAQEEEIREREKRRSYLEEQRKREEQEQKRRELMQKVQEEEIREREKRRPYLEGREKHYRSLSEVELVNQWDKRKKMDLEPDEIDLLKKIVRQVKGIKPVYGNSVFLCRQCGMVGTNCTCGRSWF